MNARLALAASILALTACATISARDADIFDRPESYLEQHVRLCGYVRAAPEDHSIWIDRNAYLLRADGDPNVSFGLEPAGDASLAAKHDRRTCVAGEVIQCGEENTCAGSAFPYAIRVTR